MTPEYTHLFNATSKLLHSLQDMLLIQICAFFSAKETAKTDPVQALEELLEHCEDEIAVLQSMQSFLVFSQQKAEDIYTERTD